MFLRQKAPQLFFTDMHRCGVPLPYICASALTITVNSHFGVYQWGNLCRGCYAENLTVDLSNVEFAYPPGLVALSLVVSYRGRNGKSTELTVPEETDVLTYLNRVDFFESLHREARIYDDLSELEDHNRNPSIRFTEVVVLKEEEIDDANTVVRRFLQKYIDGWRGPYDVFNEVLINARDHSRAHEADGAERSGLEFGVLQIQVYKNRLELALGDIGDGIRRTLNTSPDHDFESTASAMETALERGVSRFSHRPGSEGKGERGGGLRRVKNVVDEIGGTLDMRSYEGIARLKDGELHCEDHSTCFPGTLVRIELPSRDHRLDAAPDHP